MSGVSIIIPYHQHNNFIKDCLDSIVALDYSDIEVILVLDHIKSEEIKEVCTTYGRTLSLSCYELSQSEQQHRGVAVARNLGLQVATKEYVYFLDSDDYLINQGLLGLIEIAKREDATFVVGKQVATWYKRYTFLKEFHTTESSSNISMLDDIDVAKLLFQGEVSILNILIKRTLIEDNQFRFEESNRYYSDLIFLTRLLLVDAIQYKWVMSDIESYAKRSHNDSIQYPALSQMKDEKRMEQFLDAFIEAKRLIAKNQGNTQNSSNNYVQQFKLVLEKYCCEYILHAYLKQYHSGKDKVISEETFVAYSLAIQDMSNLTLHQFHKNECKILAALKDNKRNLAVKLANKIIMKQKKKGLIGNKIQRARALDKLVFRRLSVKTKYIMFESFGGKSYSDSPKYIYEYMLNKYGKEYKYIWVMRQDKKDIPGNPIVIKPNTYRYLYYLSRSKILIFNSRQPIWYNKRKEATFIQTWHGTPLKKLVFDMEDVHSASLTHKEDFYKVSRKWDYLLSDNEFSTEVFQHAFLYDKDKILEYGYPRNDLMYDRNAGEIAKQVKQELGIPMDKKVLLYAPTWRDDEYYASGEYKFTLAIDLHNMKQRLGDEYIILLRTHYFVVDQVDELCDNEFVYNGSRYEDITKLYLASDICITDYSSVFFDYANLKRPILFFTYDIEKYREELHGFYIDMETEVPGPLLQTNDELIDAIEHIDEIQENYQERYKNFYDRFCNIDDGHASERVVEKIIREGT